MARRLAPTTTGWGPEPRLETVAAGWVLERMGEGCSGLDKAVPGLDLERIAVFAQETERMVVDYPGLGMAADLVLEGKSEGCFDLGMVLGRVRGQMAVEQEPWVLGHHHCH